jgi:signal transduction histidine kinase
MRAHRRARRIASAAGLFAVAAALIPLVPFGLGQVPAASAIILLGLPVLTWLGLRTAFDRSPRELARLSSELSREPARRVRTDDPHVARLLVAIDRLLDSLAGLRDAHRDARERAEEEDRTETEFLTELSHELRTPLNAILGFAEVLLDEIDGPLTDSQREDVETIRSSGEHLSALVDDVLDMAALHSGHVALELDVVDVGRVLAEVGKLLEGQRRDKPVALRLEIPSDLPSIQADEKRVRQILMNLGSNAMKFTDEGHVVLRAEADEAGVHVAVEDTGPGIPPGERDSIFLEFTQVSGSVIRRAQGSGLGLAIVKRLTELHGGRIWLDTVTGEGSTFHVHLPFDPAVGSGVAEEREKVSA